MSGGEKGVDSVGPFRITEFFHVTGQGVMTVAPPGKGQAVGNPSTRTRIDISRHGRHQMLTDITQVDCDFLVCKLGNGLTVGDFLVCSD